MGDDQKTVLDKASEGRFRLIRQLGAGGAGLVFETYDNLRGERVALKALKRAEPRSVLRFKREFRALSELSHPNLVALHELHGDLPQWFFSMELVEGADLMAFVRYGIGERVAPAPDDFLADDIAATSAETAELDEEGTTAVSRAPNLTGAGQDSAYRPLTDLDTGDGVARFRRAFAQLAEGLRFLHQGGRLHRDLKPSNILVERGTERVVICDLGLVHDLDRSSMGSNAGQLMGSFQYMAPEQVTNQQLTEAADWYAVGVMMFQALTGRLPFDASEFELLLAKQRDRAPRVRSIAIDTPEDLAELCDALLLPEPLDRPTAADVLHVLGSANPGVAQRVPENAQGHFIGREEQLSRLRHLLDSDLRHAQFVLLKGWAGIGKTALCQRFITSLGEPDGTLVLTGRCYEAERVRFKALDSMSEQLARAIAELPEDDRDDLMPEHLSALSYLFPAFELLARSVQRKRGKKESYTVPEGASGYATEMVQRGSEAFASLLRSLARRSRLVLFLDDLHFCDRHSLEVLERLFESNPPGAFVLGSHRSEVDMDQALVALLRHCRQRPRVGVTELTLGPLKEKDVAGLLRGALPRSELHRIAQLSRDLQGNPVLLDEVMHLLRSGEALPEDVSVDGLIGRKLEALSDDGLRVMRVLTVSTQPVPLPVLAAATKVERLGAVLGQLRADKLVRRRFAQSVEALEPFNDRVRVLVAASSSDDDAVVLHRALATAYLRVRDRSTLRVPFRTLVTHWLGAGLEEDAAVAAPFAASEAEQDGDYERAVFFYDLSLSHAGERAAGGRRRDERSKPESQDIEDELERLRALLPAKHRLLAGAGRALLFTDDPELAAVRFAEAAAAREVSEVQQRGYLRYQVTALVRAGQWGRAASLYADVLDKVGMRLPPTVKHARARMTRGGFWRRVRESIRPSGEPTGEVVLSGELDRSTALKADLAWTGVSHFLLHQPSVVTSLRRTHEADAAESGDPVRLAKARVATALQTSMEGGRDARRRATGLLNWAQPYTSLDEELLGVWWLASSHVALGSGSFEKAARRAARATRILERSGGAALDLGAMAAAVRIESLFFAGRYELMLASWQDWERAATDRSDQRASFLVYFAAGYRCALLADSPDEVEQYLLAYQSYRQRTPPMRAPFDETSLLTLWTQLARVEALLYRRAYRDATSVLGEIHNVFEAGGFDRYEYLTFRYLDMVCRAAMGLLSTSGRGDEPFKNLKQAVARMLDLNTTWLGARADLHRGFLLEVEGHAAQASSLFDEADSTLAKLQAMPLRAALRIQRRQLDGQTENSSISGVSSTSFGSSSNMSSEFARVEDPHRFAQWLLPWGLPSRPLG